MRTCTGENNMTVNGENQKQSGRISLSEFLIREGFQTERIAVERNGEIVPKSSYQNTFLEDDDRLEIVNFVGGG